MNIYLRHLIIIAGFFSQFGFSASPFDGWTKSRYTVSFKSSDGDLHQMAQILNRKIGQRVGLTWQTQEHKLKMTFLPSLNKINIVGLMVAHGKENKITLSGRTYQGMTFTQTPSHTPLHTHTHKMLSIKMGKYFKQYYIF